MRLLCLAVLGLLLTAGCHNQPVAEPPCSYYHAPGLDWGRVNRVLLLPFENESPISGAPEDVRRALAAELQIAGRFEVVPAPPDVWARLSGQIRYCGRFNEAVMIELARSARADLIIHCTISQYSPYRLPRLGLVLQVVSPADAVVVASVDGLWDAACQEIAHDARLYYRQAGPAGRKAPFTETLALESPQYFQRYVCHQVVATLLTMPQPPGPPPGAGNTGCKQSGTSGSKSCATARPGTCAGSPCATDKSTAKPDAANTDKPAPKPDAANTDKPVSKPDTPGTDVLPGIGG